MTPDELRFLAWNWDLHRGTEANRTSSDILRAAADAWEADIVLLNSRIVANMEEVGRLHKRLEAAMPPPVVIRILAADTTELSEQIDNVTSLDEKEELVNWLDAIAALAGEEK